MIFIYFDSIQIFEKIASLSFQVSWTHHFLTEVKKIIDLVFFPFGLSNIRWAPYFPFDKGQSIANASARLSIKVQLIITFLLNQLAKTFFPAVPRIGLGRARARKRKSAKAPSKMLAYILLVQSNVYRVLKIQFFLPIRDSFVPAEKTRELVTSWISRLNISSTPFLWRSLKVSREFGNVWIRKLAN